MEKNKIIKRFGYVSWNDFVWTWQSRLFWKHYYAACLKICQKFGHKPNIKGIIKYQARGEWLGRQTFCNRCNQLITSWNNEPFDYMPF